MWSRRIVLGTWFLTLFLAAGAGTAQAAIVDSPPGPIPSTVSTGYPPVPQLTPAADTQAPPASAVVDPVRADTTCSGWYLQSRYADEWTTDATWWEYRCGVDVHTWYDNCTAGGACDAWCPSCFDRHETWVDMYVWNGSDAVFYGQMYSDSGWSNLVESSWAYTYWWDASSARWYDVAPASPPVASFVASCMFLGCAFDASASYDLDGTALTYAWDFGDGSASDASGSAMAAHAFVRDGTYTVTVTVTDAGAEATSWSDTVTVAANLPPTATFAVVCTSAVCAFDASASTDPDGTLVSYGWTFGDGSTGVGRTVGYDYASPGVYPATLTVTDSGGAKVSTSSDVTVISLTARSYRTKGVRRVDLAWYGPPTGTSVDVFRNGVRIATTTLDTMTDTLPSGSATYVYRVSLSSGSSSSNDATVKT
jgi:PKD repeat protein